MGNNAEMSSTARQKSSRSKPVEEKQSSDKAAIQNSSLRKHERTMAKTNHKSDFHIRLLFFSGGSDSDGSVSLCGMLLLECHFTKPCILFNGCVFCNNLFVCPNCSLAYFTSMNAFQIFSTVQIYK